MYLPIDPKKSEHLFADFFNALRAINHFHLVDQGKERPDATLEKSSSKEAINTIERLKKLPYVKIGTTKCMPTPPHFGADLSENHRHAKLVDYFSSSHDQNRINRDIYLFVDLIFLEIKELETLDVPIFYSGPEIAEASIKIERKKNITTFRRR